MTETLPREFGGTMNSTSSPVRRSGRLDRDAYFNAAFRILAARGFPELTVENLCAELGATKGSFYHHFADFAEFTAALASAWETTVNNLFATWAQLPATEGITRSLEAVQQWPMRADAAMRAWGWANPVVAAAVRRQELAWERLISAWLEPFVPDPQRRRVLTHLSLAALAGMLQLQHPHDPELMLAVCLEIIGTNIGIQFLPDGAPHPAGRSTPGSQA